jgi:hypothetical protein
MSKVHYEVVEHDGGWAYKAKGVFSEPFPTREAALAAAERAALEQTIPGTSQDIEFQDKAGRWHHEHAAGSDRPETDVTETGL